MNLTPAEQKMWNLGMRPHYENNYWYSNDDDEHRGVHKRYPSQDIDVARWEEENWPR